MNDQPKSRFEHNACTRCYGTGSYGPMSVAAGRCFKCGGTGITFTKRGAAARAFFLQSLRKPVAEVEVGEKVMCEGVPGITGSFWGIVVSKGMELANAWTSGEERPTLLTIRCEASNYDPKTNPYAAMSFTERNQPVRVAHSKEDKAAKLEAALAYQETLTKAGTPRQR